MDAFFARNRLSAYLDGVLEDSEAAEVAAAIEADPALRGEYEAMRQAIDLLRTHGPTEAPEGFHARLMARVDQEPVPGGAVVWLRQRFAQVPVEALALAAAALVVVIVIQGRPGEDPLASSEAPVEETAAAATATDLSEAPPAAEAAEALPTAAEEEPEVLAKAAPVEKAPALSKKTGKLEKAAEQKVASKQSASKEAFVPEWDVDSEEPEANAKANLKVESDSSNAGLSRPQGYRISLSHPRVLYDLSNVADQTGGRMIDASGRQLSPRALTYEDNYAQVHLAVPADQLGAVQKSLRKLGAVESPPPGATPLYGPNQVGFVIDVHYMP